MRPFALPLTIFLASATAACGRLAPSSPGSGGPPQRVVAASVASAEILLAIAPRERLAAVHPLAVDPRFCAAAALATTVPTVAADPEGLLACRPDLVVLDPFTRPETRALLEGAGVRVWAPREAADFDGIFANIAELGRLVGCGERADALITTTRARIAAIEAAADSAEPWRVLSLDGALNTYGKGSLFDALVNLAGARNLAAERGVGPFRRLDVEAVLAWRPDALVIAVLPGDEASEREWLRQTPGLHMLPCVQKQRLVFLPMAIMGSTSHHVVEAATLLQRQLRDWGRP